MSAKFEEDEKRKFSTEWLEAEAKKLGDRVFLLLQGYPMTGFARMAAGKLEFPAGFKNPDWNLFWDIRMFGSGGEWRLWRAGKWQGLFRGAEEWPKARIIDRDYVLWGNDKPKPADSSWFRYSEANGVQLWSPIEKPKGHVLRLKVRELIGFEQERTGLAGIVDAMILDLYEEEVKIGPVNRS